MGNLYSTDNIPKTSSTRTEFPYKYTIYSYLTAVCMHLSH